MRSVYSKLGLRRLLASGARAAAPAEAEAACQGGPYRFLSRAAEAAQEITPGRLRAAKIISLSLPFTGLGIIAYGFLFPDPDPLLHLPRPKEEDATESTPTASADQQHIVNWSATHEVTPKAYYQPESEEEVERIVAEAHREGRRVRVLGSGLSPNGIGFSGEGMMSMALLDRVLEVDKALGQVRVQAGCRVQQVADALKPRGLTLQNYASIREQQIGGFTQVGAHGTGAAIPPVDEQVVGFKLVTPAKGTMYVTRESDPELFEMARVGLGALGVVTEVVLQCVPAHRLLEETFVASAKEIRKQHGRWMTEFQHLRYMWIPHTQDVVVVRSNPLPAEGSAEADKQLAAPPQFTDDERLAPLRDLLKRRSGQADADINDLSPTQLRDALLALGPLDLDWVKAVNAAEAQYWRRSAGVRAGWSDEILGFDCGGQQWVLEVAFPVGQLSALTGWWPKYRDLDYMAELLRIIDKEGVPAPSPIEQRWTAGSGSALSPARGEAGGVHSWVGVIMYLPEEDGEARQAVTDAFHKYAQLVEDKMMPKYNALWHWAKLEPGSRTPEQLAGVRRQLAARLPVQKFLEYRRRLDPKNILGNDLVDAVLPVE